MTRDFIRSCCAPGRLDSAPSAFQGLPFLLPRGSEKPDWNDRQIFLPGDRPGHDSERLSAAPRPGPGRRGRAPGRQCGSLPVRSERRGPAAESRCRPGPAVLRRPAPGRHRPASESPGLAGRPARGAHGPARARRTHVTRDGAAAPAAGPGAAGPSPFRDTSRFRRLRLGVRRPSWHHGHAGHPGPPAGPGAGLTNKLNLGVLPHTSSS